MSDYCGLKGRRMVSNAECERLWRRHSRRILQIVRQTIAMFRTLNTLAWFCSAWFAASAATAAGAVASARELFDPGQAHTIQIKLSGERWDLLQPGAGAQKAAGITN